MTLKTVDFNQLFTFSRPSPKWVWNAQGRLIEVPADEPAYQHDPVTGTSLGFGIKDEAANYYTKTNDMSAKDHAGYVTTVVNSIFESGVVANLFTRDTVTGAPLGQGMPVVSDGTVMTVWMIVEQGTADITQIGLRDQTAAVWAARVIYNFVTDSLEGQTPNSSGTIAPVYARTVISEAGPNGGRVVLVSCTADVAEGKAVFLNIYPEAAADNVGAGTIVHFAQLESGARPTSPIITDGSAVIRAADVPVIENLDTATWFGGEQGAFLIEFSGAHRSSNNTFARLLSYGNTVRWFYVGVDGTLRAWDGGTVLSSAINVVQGGHHRAIITWNTDAFKLVVGGNVS